MSTSYGHALRFGVELAGQDPSAVVEAAQAAEALGADVVTLAERGNSGGADALTLTAWVAARTSRLQVGATGIDPEARPASTLARATASLQLLSGDRGLLVLDAGASARDAIAVIRTLHDTGNTRTSHDGVHHRVTGADPGPTIERGVSLWVRGASAAAIALAGEAADGWLVDHDLLGPTGMDERRRALDGATTRAGRDVREVRRGVVLSPDASRADTLVSLALDHGVSWFLLRVDEVGSADAAEQMRVFLSDIAPVVRTAVESALPAGALSSRPVRRADVRARRRPGIAYDDVPEDLADTAVEPGDPAYGKVRSTYLRGGDPGLVLRPQDVDEVASALAFARRHRHLPLGLRSGGHGISGRSTNDGGLVIDVGALNEITVLDEARRLVRIGPGARWRDVAKALQPRGWALSSGDYGGVGVGGLATTGGIGFLNRAHGLTIDHLQAVEMVLADGTFARATETQHPELFWAARGAGANFGVAVAFEFVVDEVDEVGWAQLAFHAPDPAAYLRAFGEIATAAPRETTPFLVLGQGVARIMAMVDTADPEVIVEQLQPFAEIAPLAQQQVVVAPYAAVMNMFPESPHNGRGEPVSRSLLAREITPEFASASADLIRSGASHWYQIRTVGGAVADVPTDATAYAHRDARFSLTVMGAQAQRLDRWFEPLRRHASGLYLSFESDRSPERLTEAFPPATLRRLEQLKAELDPHNLFQDNFNITPSTTWSAR